jgi:hypothetical protein
VPSIFMAFKGDPPKRKPYGVGRNVEYRIYAYMYCHNRPSIVYVPILSSHHRYRYVTLTWCALHQRVQK